MAVQLVNPVAASPSLISTAGIPTPDQYSVIESLAPIGSLPPPRELWYTVPILASCNLISREGGRYSIPCLQQMAAMLPGNPLMLDHGWDRVKSVIGLNLSAQLIRIPPINSIQQTSLLGRSGYFEENQQIVAREGFVGLIVQATVFQSEIIYRLQAGSYSRVSIGGFSLPESYFCPNCQLPLSDHRCPHVPPGYGPYSGKPECDYLEIGAMADMVELSIVGVPKMPGMGVINESHWLAEMLFPYAS